MTVNAFVRNKTKLQKQFPNLEQATGVTINIIVGTPDQQEPLRRALKGVEVVFQCIATNESKSTNHIVEDSSSAVIEALNYLRKDQGPSYITPTVLMLRSVSLDERYIAQTPWLVHWFLMFCLHYAYLDIDRGCKLIERTATEMPGLLEYVHVDPPAIHDPEGTKRTGHKLMLDGMPTQTVSYADLGAAFRELAEYRGKYSGKEVGVSATGEVKQTWGILMGYLFWGAVARVTG